MAHVFTIEAHPTDPELVLYRHVKDGVEKWAHELPADDYRSRINQSFPTTDLRDGSQVVWAPGPLQIAEGNRTSIEAKAAAALGSNKAALAHAPIPAGALTVAQLSNIVRALTDRVDALTRQNNQLIRLVVDLLDDDEDT